MRGLLPHWWWNKWQGETVSDRKTSLDVQELQPLFHTGPLPTIPAVLSVPMSLRTRNLDRSLLCRRAKWKEREKKKAQRRWSFGLHTDRKALVSDCSSTHAYEYNEIAPVIAVIGHHVYLWRGNGAQLTSSSVLSSGTRFSPDYPDLLLSINNAFAFSIM